MELASITKRQKEIIEAAGMILARSGIGGLTTKNLAKELNFTESALYRHFNSKEDIIVSMLDYLACTMDQHFSEIIDTEKPLDVQLMALFDAQFKLFNDNKYFVVVVLSDDLIQNSVAMTNAVKRIMSVKSSHLTTIVEQGQSQGVIIDTIPCDQIIHVIMGAFRLLIVKWRMDSFKFNIKEKGGEMMQALLTMIRLS